MEPELYIMSVGDKHYVSGTIYTPDGIKQYNGVLDDFEQLFTLFPTFATGVSCYHDEVCKRDRIDFFYYLTYHDELELEKMLSFMDNAPVQYLNFIPHDVVKKMDIHIEGTNIRIGGIDILKNIDCKIIGSIPVALTVTPDYIFINGVKIGQLDESGDYIVCDEIINLSNGIIPHLACLLSCYFSRYYKGTPTWSEVLRTWCGIRTSLKM